MNVFNFNGGYNFMLRDGSDSIVSYILPSKIIGISPPRVINFKSKICVKVNQKIVSGDVLFYHRKQAHIKITSPVSGVIKSIVYGPKRVLEVIEIIADEEKSSQYKKFKKMSIDLLNKKSIITTLIDSGIWHKFRKINSNDFLGDENTFLKNQNALFLSLFSTEPHLSQIKFLLTNKNYMQFFLYGLRICSLLFNNIHIFDIDRNVPQKIFDFAHDISNIDLYQIENKYPAENSGLQHFLINNNKKNVVNISTRIFALIEIGHLFIHENVIKERYINLSGNGLLKKHHLIVVAGTSLRAILMPAMQKTTAKFRIISGGLLTGHKLHLDKYLSDDDTALHVSKEDTERIPLFFFRLGWNNMTMLKTWGSGFLPPQTHSISTNNNGEERACVQCGYCIDVCPVQIMPSLIMKASISNNIEKMEHLFINDCIHCELCTFVCPSKIEIVQHIKNGKDFIRKEG